MTEFHKHSVEPKKQPQNTCDKRVSSHASVTSGRGEARRPQPRPAPHGQRPAPGRWCRHRSLRPRDGPPPPGLAGRGPTPSRAVPQKGKESGGWPILQFERGNF